MSNLVSSSLRTGWFTKLNPRAALFALGSGKNPNICWAIGFSKFCGILLQAFAPRGWLPSAFAGIGLLLASHWKRFPAPFAFGGAPFALGLMSAPIGIALPNASVEKSPERIASVGTKPVKAIP